MRATGDSLHDWASYSVFHVAVSKGGTGHVFADPLRLPWHTVNYFENPATIVIALYLFASVFAWIALIRPFLRSKQLPDLPKFCVGAVILVMPALYLWHVLLDSMAVLVIPLLGILLVYGIGVAVVVRLLLQLAPPSTVPGWNPRETSLCSSLWVSWPSGSMSTGAEPLGLSGPLGMTILLLPIASPIHLRRESVRAFAFALVTLVAVLCAAQKYREPFFWHSYKLGPMFTGRQWYHHPDYGPMVIERDDLAFIQPVCDAVRADGAQQGLLSCPTPIPTTSAPSHPGTDTFRHSSTPQAKTPSTDSCPSCKHRRLNGSSISVSWSTLRCTRRCTTTEPGCPIGISTS